MSIKPSVVFIKGVHSTTGSDKTSDIGFPQLELEKLFEGATLKEYKDDYDPNKKLIYKENSYKNIESSAQFTCLKNGYSMPPAFQEYFYKSSDNYIKHTVPDLSTWENKLSESNFIKDKTIYTISNPNNWIYVKIGNDYYDYANSSYNKKTISTYHCYDTIEVNLTYEYKLTVDFETYNSSWSVTNGGSLQDGFFIYKDGNSITNLGYIKFDSNSQISKGNALGHTSNIYRINYSQSFYIIESGKMKKVENIGNSYTTDDGKIYNYVSNYTYPNTSSYQTNIICDSSDQIITNTFNIYKELAAPTVISPVSYKQAIIYEKTDKVNYNYSADANSLKLVFTDKTIPEVIKVCGLPNDIDLEKYVHLTNLEYNNR